MSSPSLYLCRALIRTILISSFLLMAFAFGKYAAKASPAPGLPTFLYTVTAHYEPLAWMHGADRFASGATIFVRDAGSNRPLVPGFTDSADPALSFDGQRVLFSGKSKVQDPWQIWEISLSGGSPRRITNGDEDCVRPFYLPDDRAIYACRTAGRFVIEVADLAGGKTLPLTYGPANFLPADVLRDGRILFESASPLGTDAGPEIYTVYSDGSGVESYRCDHGEGRHSGRQVSSGDIIFSSNHGLARFTSAKDQQVPISAPAGEYIGEVAETTAGDWLLAWRAETNAHFQVMSLTPSAAKLLPVVAEQSLDVVQPALIAARSVPNRHPSGLHDWPNANLLCLNAYTSKYHFAAGSIRSVRLYTRDDGGNPRLLGTAPVERDGSFFVQLPTEKPLQIELLDSAGKTLKREAGFFWMRRGEQRACVGCHAGPEISPENAVPMILLKSTTPADLAGAIAPSASGGN